MKPPNILLISAETHPWNAWSYGGGALRMPNLDALARHGMAFDQAVSTFPMSVPARATMLTGQYPSRHGVRDLRGAVPLDWPTFPQLLRKAGYHTGAVGALHLSAGHANYGFDVLHLTARADNNEVSASEASPASIGNQAVRFLQQAREPFLLWAAFPGPSEVNGEVQSALGAVDQQIGRVMATLAGRGFTNNAVVYTADRGEAPEVDEEMATLRESAIRVPLIISGLAGQRRGDTTSALAALTDVAPTLLAIAKVSAPDTMQGANLAPLVMGASTKVRDAAYVEWLGGLAAARDGRLKYIDKAGVAMRALYNVQTDPEERHNVAGQPKFAQDQARLIRVVRKWR